MRHSSVLLSLLLVGVSLAFAGCSGSAGTQSQASTTAATRAAATTQATPTETPSPTVAQTTTSPAPTPTPTPTYTFTYPTVSPTGRPASTFDRKIVFSAKSGAHSQIYAVNDDGTGLTNISNSSVDDMTPRWSPNRDIILFARLQGGDTGSGTFSVSPDGSNMKQMSYAVQYPVPVSTGSRDPLLDNSSDILLYSIGQISPLGTILNTDIGALSFKLHASGWIDTNSGKYQDSNPALSPDNKKMVFSSNRNGPWDIYTVDFSGVSLVSPGSNRLTINISTASKLTTNADSSQARWSPDGTKLVYSVGMRVSGKYVYQVFVMNADGSNQTNVSNSTSSDTSPDWSPDGKRIAFLSDRDGSQQLYIMNADGSGVTKVTSSAGTKDSVSWR